ncbi:Aste57867_16611 [Aphanomyces stellatus]|uniref:Aste57867_16611 protein n=1 Tax=Aphanomyces stellatus TaxID=120398 RepID=A0A485L5V2_9STRA|nr:hypothetical protein As57867_016554 [Aphanomyces stellatus]VFT93382.1 Aste57867_16611 [Aphanomyces stellatus]
MNCAEIHATSLLPALLAVTSTSTTLLGPTRCRKQIADPEEDDDGSCGGKFTSKIATIMKSLESEHPVCGIMQRILETHLDHYGTGGTTLVSFVHVLAGVAVDLRRHYPPHEITCGFDVALDHCTSVLDAIKIDVAEWLAEMLRRRGPAATPLAHLGAALASSQPDQRVCMDTAIDIAAALGDAFDMHTWPRHVHFHDAAGVDDNSVHVGLLLPIASDDEILILPSTKICRAIALVDGDVRFHDDDTRRVLSQVDLLVASGNVCTQTQDWCRTHDIACVVLASISMASFCGVARCESLREWSCAHSAAAPVALSSVHRHNQVFAHFKSLAKSTHFVTVLVARPTRHLAEEAHLNVETALHRLARAWHDKAALPGGGAAFMACAASLTNVVESDTSAVVAGFRRALLDWCLVLLDVSSSSSSLSYLETKTHVATIDQRFLDGMQDAEFLARTYFGPKLTPLTTPQLKFDGYESTKAALAAAVRAVTLVLNTQLVLVNRPPMVQATP